MDIDAIYNQLTDVDIEEQKLLWDERGKGYYGEYLVFCELYKDLSGYGKILMNLQLPTENSRTTEVDLLLIHETGLYVFEVKHYKGTIYGKDTDENWTQFFRTAKNNVFRNPVLQNQYHIAALRRLLPQEPLYSCVVFTGDNGEIRVSNANSYVDVCELHELHSVLERRFSKKEDRLSIEEVDKIFERLSPYSKMKEPIMFEGETADFFTWIEPVVRRLEEKKSEVETAREEWKKETKRVKRSRKVGIVINVVIAVVTIALAVLFSLECIRENNRELATFKQKFLHVDEIGNPYIDTLRSYVDVSDVLIAPLTDDAVSFTARLSMKNDFYGVALTENSKYLVMSNAGKLFEYDVFPEHTYYSKTGNCIGKGVRSYLDLATTPFYGIANAYGVSYVKITGVELFKLDIRRTVIQNELEIELYSSPIE